MVERDLAKVEVASSTLVSRSNSVGIRQRQKAGYDFDCSLSVPTAYFHLRRRSQVVRQRSAKPLFIGSIPIAASTPFPSNLTCPL